MRIENQPPLPAAIWRAGRGLTAGGQVLIGLIVPLLAGSVAATATSLLRAFTSVTVCTSGQLGVVSGVSSCSQTDGNGSDNLTLAVAPFAGLGGNAVVAAGVVDSFGVFGALNYSVEVVGGNPGDQVPLLIFADLFTSVSDSGGYAFAEILATTSLATDVGEVACLSPGGSCPGNATANFSDSFSVNATSGSISTIHLEIDVQASPALQSGESAMAIADPLIVVDPNFAGAANYSILLSPGVANSIDSTAPEPDTSILVCCGGLLLFAGRRCFQR